MGDGVEDVVDVVAEVEHGVGDDRLGGGDAGRKQGQRGGQRQRGLQLLHRCLLQEGMSPSITLDHPAR